MRRHSTGETLHRQQIIRYSNSDQKGRTRLGGNPAGQVGSGSLRWRPEGGRRVNSTKKARRAWRGWEESWRQGQGKQRRARVWVPEAKPVPPGLGTLTHPGAPGSSSHQDSEGATSTHVWGVTHLPRVVIKERQWAVVCNKITDLKEGGILQTCLPTRMGLNHSDILARPSRLVYRLHQPNISLL